MAPSRPHTAEGSVVCEQSARAEQLASRCYPAGAQHTAEMIADLSARACEYRAQVLRMVHGARSGHIGGAFSISEILTALYFHQLDLRPEEPDWPDRDRLVFSKGHACAMLYTVLAHRGYFSAAELQTFRKLNSRLQGHPDPEKTPGVEVAAGPLGHGVAIGAGMALAARLQKSPRRVWVILGDGELNSGVIWEGAMTAAKYALDRLVAIVDRNRVQQTGTTQQVMPTEPLADKWRSFQWHVLDMDGHDMRQVLDTLDAASELRGKPTVILARTTKGKGVRMMEGSPKWHGGVPDDAQFHAALEELEEAAQRWRA
jgi:transketolase